MHLYILDTAHTRTDTCKYKLTKKEIKIKFLSPYDFNLKVFNKIVMHGNFPLGIRFDFMPVY